MSQYVVPNEGSGRVRDGIHGVVRPMASVFASVCIGALFVVLPGFLALRAVGIGRLVAVAAAPLPTVLAYNVIFAVAGIVGLSMNWIVAFVPVAAISILLYACLSKRAQPVPLLGDVSAFHEAPLARFPSMSYVRWCVVAYLAFGAIACAVLFTQGVFNEHAFIQSFDNVHHMGAVRAFLESGTWSSLGTSLYLGSDSAFDPFVSGSFYPSAFHALAAMIASCIGVEVTCAVNAVLLLFIGLVFPLGMLVFIASITDNDPKAVVAAAPLCLANAALPWMLLTWGPLYSNVMAYCMLPALLVAFIGATRHGSTMRSRVVGGCLFALGAASMLFVQPNGAFAAGLLLAPYCVSRIARKVGESERFASCSRRAALLAGIASTVVIIAVWTALFVLPPLQGVVWYNWPPEEQPLEAVFDVLFLSFRVHGMAIAGTALLVAGIVRCIKQRKLMWLVVTFALTGLTYVAAVSFSGFWQHYLAGFWYTDAPRVAALCAMAAVPLEAIGLVWAVDGAVAWRARKGGNRTALAGVLAVVGVLAVLFIPYRIEAGFAWHEIINPLGIIQHSLSHEYNPPEGTVLDSYEQYFVEKAMEVLPEGAIVVNEPNDGSAYVYGGWGMKTCYRYWRGYGEDDEKPWSKVLRERLCNVADDPEVQQAVRESGVGYVLQLDQGDFEWWQRMWTYEDGAAWRGIDAIRDDTSGFEVVLSEEDMRVYKIVIQ